MPDSKPSEPKGASEIISTVTDIYRHFHIPSNLERHMLWVAAVGALICDHWKGPKVERDNVVAVLLLHDLGNIVKYNLDNPSTTGLLQPDLVKLDFWRVVKADVIRQYGTDDHEVTMKMLAELNMDPILVKIADDMAMVEDGVYDVTKTDNWPLKICIYSDMRVGFNGPISVKERLADLLKRYKGTYKEPKFRAMGGMLDDLQHEVEGNISIRPEDINEKLLSEYVAKL